MKLLMCNRDDKATDTGWYQRGTPKSEGTHHHIMGFMTFPFELQALMTYPAAFEMVVSKFACHMA